MEDEKVVWLRSVYQEIPSDHPCRKKIKLSELHERLQEKYSSEKLSHHAVSHIVHEAFPNAEGKISGKSRTQHILGIAPIPDAVLGYQAPRASTERPPSIPAPITALLESERSEKIQLMEKIKHLEVRIQELEQSSPSNLTHQADQLPHGSLVTCGPDTPGHFLDFSFDRVVCDLKKHTPDMYKFFMQLGNVHRNADCDAISRSTEEIKALTSLCILLNARSARTKGIQLILSMMLVARSTSKQVCIHTIVEYS